jgi:hypothetical protein
MRAPYLLTNIFVTKGSPIMGRLVRVPREISADLSSGYEDIIHADVTVSQGSIRYVQADGYLERIAKYIPAEVLAFSVFINAMLDQSLRAGGKDAMMGGMPVATIATATLIAGTILTPFFMWYVRRPGDAWGTNAFVSTLVFPFWSYALGSAAFSGYWDGNLAAILVASVSVISGLISPRMPRSKRRGKERERDYDEERMRPLAMSRERLQLATANAKPELAPAPVVAAAAAAGTKK